MGIFRFKHFDIDDTSCAMKTGTDAVLLGAWFPLTPKSHLLDIGCGSGILSLMAAQRESSLTITAIEIDHAAAEQARDNVARSPFANTIRIISADVNHYCLQNLAPFHHIICNPPYFRNSLKSPLAEKNRAKHDVSLTYPDLLNLLRLLLHEDGTAGVILPYQSSQEFMLEASTMGLFVRNQLIVKHTNDKPKSRALLEFTKHSTPPLKAQTLTICNSDLTWSADYKALTRDFYLHV